MFRFLAHLYNNDVGNNVAFKFVETRVHLSVIELFTAISNRPERQCGGIHFGVNSQDIQNNLWCRTVITTTNDHSVTDDTDKLALVVIGKSSQRIQTLTKLIFAFCVSRDLANDEFVENLGMALVAELERREDCNQRERGNDSHFVPMTVHRMILSASKM